MHTPRLKDKYNSTIISALKNKFGYKNVMEIPKLLKISINQGVGAAVADKKLVDTAVLELTTIAGQKAVPTYSKKDVSNFKLRSKMPIGTKVTLRQDNMYEFLDRLISIALPRVRDFQGINDKGFDGRGSVLRRLVFHRGRSRTAPAHDRPARWKSARYFPRDE